MNTIQTYLQSAARAPVEYITEYPPNAGLLPEDIRRNAYGATCELPPEFAIPELDTIFGLHKLRGGRRPAGSSSSKTEASLHKKLPVSAANGTNPPLPKHDGPLPFAEVFRFR